MIKTRWVLPIFLVIAVLSLFCLACFELPADPRTQSNCKVELLVTSSNGLSGDELMNDSVGKKILVRVAFTYPEFIRSTNITRFSSLGAKEFDTMVVSHSTEMFDTVGFSMLLNEGGEKKLVVISNIDGGILFADTITLVVFGAATNHKPVLLVGGTKTVAVAQTCTLTVSGVDSDGDDILYTMAGKPATAQFNAPIFFWTPTVSDIGKHTMTFFVMDNGSPALKDSQVVSITVTGVAIPQNSPPTISVTGRKNIVASEICSLAVKVTDIDSLQRVTVKLIDPPVGSTMWGDTLFTWQSPTTDTVLAPILFVATDNGIPPASDTSVVIIRASHEIVLPSAPADAHLAGKLDGVLTVAWQSVAGADNYTVSRSETNEGTFTFVGSTTDTVWKDTIGNNTFYYIVQSVNSRGVSASIDTLFSGDLKNQPPRWITDTLMQKGIRGATLSVTFADKCSDPDGDIVAFSLVLPSVGTINSSLFQFTPAADTPDELVVQIVATDTKGGADTVSLKLQIEAAPAIPIDDTTKPAIVLSVPTVDASIVSASTVVISVSCIDNSGIASVECSMAATPFIVTNVGNLYAANISGLKPGENTITFVATDGSANANANKLLVHILYDSTIADNTGPVFQKESGPVSGSTINNSSIKLVYSITDASGVGEVSWTLNGGGVQTITKDLAGTYSIATTLDIYHKNTIVVTAVDKSTAGNVGTETITFDYNVAPVTKGQTAATTLNNSLEITLSADAIDGDILSGWKYTQPVNGVITGTGPKVTYTPKAGYVGSDSFTFTVSDGTNTSTAAKVTVAITETREEPAITKQPVGGTVCEGKSVDLSVTAKGTDVKYQWKKGTENISGATTATYSATASGSYSVVVSNAIGTSTSSAAVVTVHPIPGPPTIDALPGVCSGQSVVLPSTSKFGAKLIWFSGACGQALLTDLTVKPATTTDYYAQVETDGCLSGCTKVTISVTSLPPKPTITSIGGAICSGSDVVLTATVVGGATITWYKGSTVSPVLVGTGASYKVTGVTAATSFFVRAENGNCFGDWATGSVGVSIISAVKITIQPVSSDQTEGGTATFKVTATGGGTVSYAWKKDGNDIGVKSATLTLTGLKNTDAGKYTCIVSNACNSETSSAGILTVKVLELFAADGNTVFLTDFNNNAKDVVSGTTGLLSGSSYVTALFGSGITFNTTASSKSICTFPASSKINITSGSLEVLFYADSVTDDYTHLIDKSWLYGVTAFEGDIALTFGSSWWYSSVPLPLQKWTYICGTYDGTTISLYINGSLVGSSAYNRSGGVDTYDLGIGNATVDSHNVPFDGIIDGVRISKTVRSAQEIKSAWDLISKKL